MGILFKTIKLNSWWICFDFCYSLHRINTKWWNKNWNDRQGNCGKEFFWIRYPNIRILERCSTSWPCSMYTHGPVQCTHKYVHGKLIGNQLLPLKLKQLGGVEGKLYHQNRVLTFCGLMYYCDIIPKFNLHWLTSIPLPSTNFTFNCHI